MFEPREFVEYIVKYLVDRPEEVKVTEKKGTGTTIYNLHVSKGDMGKVIGKHGQTITAIRFLLNAISGKVHRFAILELIEEM
jgi:predicted RNA-binding protein YlqC (UPF0109 family)